MSAQKSVVFIGSKPVGYQCLAHLIQVAGTLGVSITAVLTQTRKEFGGNNDLAALASDAGIPMISEPDEIPECDFLYSVQYHKILSREIIAKATVAALNLHMAPLPEYRGANQFSYAIIEDKKEFGATIHLIDDRIDHGDILFQKRFAIPEACWVDELYRLTEAASVALFKETLPLIVSGNYTRVPQNILVGAHGTSLHYKSEMAFLKKIDLSWDEEKIERRIRATYMPGFEPPYTIIAGRKIFFTSGE